MLAASLAYQYGLEWGAVRSRSFRFVVIDEAFNRGPDESGRYGLELFRRINLQLLIVTPLQKSHIIEPHVAGLGFVHGEEGRQSMLRYLSIAPNVKRACDERAAHHLGDACRYVAGLIKYGDFRWRGRHRSSGADRLVA